MWLPFEDDYLKSNHETLTIPEIAKYVGKSETSVKKRIKKFGLSTAVPKKNNSRWTKEEDEYIKDNYRKLSVREIAIYINRSEKATRSHIERLGIKLKKLRTDTRTHLIRQPLITDWSDSEIEILVSNMDMTALQIQKTLLPHRTLSSIYGKYSNMGKQKKPPKGYYFDSDGRKHVYIRHGVHIPEHRLIIEKHLGRKLERNEIVHHIDCDKKNNTIQNLHVFESISDHMATHHSLNAIIPKLLKKRIIKFDKKTGKYVLDILWNDSQLPRTNN
tara:strand:+ start:165 stop:986 length:822 start_codon:yes stop_codon:yes gene_type:complete